MGRNALIAGGAGFIGSHFCDFLVAKGYRVTVVDSLITGQKKNIQHLIDSKKIEFIEADICNSELFAFVETPAPMGAKLNHPEDYDSENTQKLSHLLKSRGPFDEIYDLASPASPIDFERIPLYILRTGAIGHQNLCELARFQKAKILFTSTSEVYGDPEVHPQKESYFGNVNTVGPRGCYDEAKRFGEAVTMAYHRQYRLETRIARIFNTYGPRMRETDGRIIPNFFMQGLKNEPLTVYGTGSQTRSFCYVADMCEGLYALMQSNETRPVNIGNPREMTVLEMAETVKKITNNSQSFKYLPLPENDPKMRRPDISRAQEVLKWEPRTSLEDGLRETLKYFRSTQGI